MLRTPLCEVLGMDVPIILAANLLYWDQVSVVLLAIFVVVILAEIIVTTVRAKVL
jgi:phosphonate transport system permease protein